MNPGMWIVFNKYIINDTRITYIKDSTLIIHQYLLNESKIYILYHVLKTLKHTGAILKILSEKEFLIVHVYDQELLNIIVNNLTWRLYQVYYLLKEIDSSVTLDEENELIYNKDNEIKITEKTIFNNIKKTSYQYSSNENILKEVLNQMMSDL